MVGIMASAPGEIPAAFLAAQSARMAAAGTRFPVLVLDENDALREHPLKQRWRLATRQARISGCSRLSGMVRLLVYQALVRVGSKRHRESAQRFPDGTQVVHVPNLNRPAAIEAITAAGCDLVCLMGARILSAKTITALGAPVVNIHSSDPRWVRGGPVIIWEVLDQRACIQLTVHEVVEALDAGAILATAEQRILYSGGIGSTTRGTMRAAHPVVSNLFARVIAEFRDRTVQRTPFQPGDLRVTPTVLQTTRAEILCRLRGPSG